MFDRPYSVCYNVAQISAVHSEGGRTTLFFRVSPARGKESVVYAIMRDRGIQYRVEKGQVLEIALLDAEPGDIVEIGEVLLIGGDSPIVGSPTVEGAKVVARVLAETKGEKIVVFRYKSKKRYRRRTGHRQRYTRVAISDIIS